MVNWPADAKKPERVQLVMSKDKTDSITASVQQQKAAAQAREQLNLLYVALTRTREYLFVSGVAAKRSSSGWYPLLHNAMTSITADEATGILTYSFGKPEAAPSVKKETTSRKDEIEIQAELSLPIKTLPSTEHMIAPSRANQFHDTLEMADDPLDSEHGQTRGIVIHRALDLLSRINALSPQKTLQQLASENGLSTKNPDLKNWLKEAIEISEAAQFEVIFSPAEGSQNHNEIPLLYEADHQAVYGLIDRLVIGEKEILLIDYKTHAQVTSETAKAKAESFKQQMSLYREGVQRIWPDHIIRTGLLFTACAELVWL